MDIYKIWIHLIYPIYNCLNSKVRIINLFENYNFMAVVLSNSINIIISL